MRNPVKTITVAALIALAIVGGTWVALGPATAVENAPRSAEFSDPAGLGQLDGQRFDTEMGQLGQPPDVVDFVQFDQGLFLSKECEDRCNFPASAYFARDVDGGTDFIVEAYCPTKSTTMAWRGSIRGDTITGTVEWTASRFYWTVTRTLEFNGTRSALPITISR